VPVLFAPVVFEPVLFAPVLFEPVVLALPEFACWVVMLGKAIPDARLVPSAMPKLKF